MTDRLVAVGFPSPPGSVYTYELGEGMAQPELGTRLLVPLGRSHRVGFAMGPGEPPPEGSARAVLEVLDPEPPVTAELLDFLGEAARYYMVPLADFLKLAVSASAWPPSRAAVRITEAGRSALAAARRSEGHLPLRFAQTGDEATRMLAAVEKRALTVETLSRKGLAVSPTRTLSRLVAEGLVALAERAGRRPAAGGEEAIHEAPPEPARALHPEQAAVVDALEARLRERAGARPVLLHGVTASGKTEVYVRAMQAALDLGGSVLYLAPEIALSEALRSVVERGLGREVAMLHSGMSETERRRTHARILSGEVRAAMGPRSAIFAPLVDLALIIVDEEHEPTFKSSQHPRFHARDMAVLRAHRCGALVVLGSATPSLESYHHAERGRYERLEMKVRARGGRLPEVRLADMRHEFRVSGHPRLISRALQEALEGALARGEQGIVLLNRRGYASQLLCRQCGKPVPCHACSQPMVFHKGMDRLLCHLCAAARLLPRTCPECRGELLELRGAGTERVHQELATLFPEAAVERVDGDLTPLQVERTLLAFRDGRSRILVGTQIIAKGHDFANVGVVGVLHADGALAIPDFRGGERTFQLLTQVSGRAGRSATEGRVVLQCWSPEHHALTLAVTQDYRAFYEREIRLRSARLMPPKAFLVLVTCLHERQDAAARMASLAAAAAARRGVDVLGPAPALRARVMGMYRHQVVLRSRARQQLREAAAPLAAASASAVPFDVAGGRVIVDFDPVEML